MKDKHELFSLNEKAWRFSESWSFRDTWCGVCTDKMHSELKLITQHERAWWQVLLERPKASGKLDAMFSCHSEPSQNTFAGKAEVRNWETVSRVVFILFLDFLTRQMLGNHFLMETRIICSIQRGLTLWSRNIKCDLLTIVSKSFSNKLMLKDWNWRTPITDILNLEEKNLTYKKNYRWRKRFSEMGEIKRAQERRIDEISAQITRRFSSSLPIAANAGTDEFHERFWRRNFLNFEMLDARFASALNKIIPNSHFKKKVSLEEQKAQKEDEFSRGRQISFMIYDYFRVSGAHDAVLDYADWFSVTVQNDNDQEFDFRWDEVLFICQRYHPMMSWKVCPNWGYGSLINSKPY